MNQNNSTVVHIPDVITVSDFSKEIKVPATTVIAELMKNGVMASINELIDFDTAAIVGSELGFVIERSDDLESGRPSVSEQDKLAEIITRPPVVAVMGHVDHGKTSLLDAIRKSNVAGGEAGGITQHIGAYQVERKKRLITFLDTPGHEAFAAIRAHGARMTDVAVIVVAADDGVKPQTKEAVAHAKATDSKIIVAINKIDKPAADINKVKQELADIDLTPDDWGGETPCINVSAKTNEGIEQLLDMILLVTDIIDPSARKQGNARGLIIESHMQSGRGSVVTVLVQEGTLKLGDYVIAQSSYGKVKSLEDFTGKKIKSATPSMPAVVLGLKNLPGFGDWFEVVSSEKVAKEWINNQAKKATVKSLMSVRSATAKDITEAVEEGKIKELALVIKADVAGSLQSLISSLELIGNSEVRVKVISSGVGDISESDVASAMAAKALIVGFNVSISAAINQLAKRSGVNFRLYHVIYEVIDDVREWLSEMLGEEVIEQEVGSLEILAVFKTTKDQIVTGGKVVSGKVIENTLIHVFRKKEHIFDTKLISLQRNKEVVSQVREGEECGIVVDAKGEIEVGDRLVFYTAQNKKRSLV